MLPSSSAAKSVWHPFVKSTDCIGSGIKPQSFGVVRHANMQPSDAPNFDASFDLTHDMVYQPSIYPRYSWETDKTLMPTAREFIPTSPSETMLQERLLRTTQAYAPSSPAQSFLLVPEIEHGKIKTVSARSASAGSETGGPMQRIDTPQAFFQDVCLFRSLFRTRLT